MMSISFTCRCFGILRTQAATQLGFGDLYEEMLQVSLDIQTPPEKVFELQKHT